MKILVLTKRYTSAKDISREDVGRPYCLFAALADLGHEVTFLLGDYTRRERADTIRGKTAFRIRPLSPARLPRFRHEIAEELRCGYDLLIAEGDPVFALLASGPCRAASVPLVYDLMDNYETYAIYRLPFFGLVDHRLIRRAELVVCVTESLRGKIAAWRTDNVRVVGNGVNAAQFRPLERDECRGRLSLPGSGCIIGYFGYIVDYKGIDILLRAHEILRRKGVQATLLLAGDMHPSVKLPGGVIYRGLVPQRDITAYINACDAVAVPSPSNPYTDYCFPLKVLEGAACGVPVIATALGPVRELLGEGYRWLVRPGDPHDLAAKMGDACRGGRDAHLRELAVAHGWIDQARVLERALMTLGASRATSRL
ncbi:MAG: glycosyltransferase family 4 protein [Candidatus Aureabacteria bacterium]|nr:glycosyltransferase family 4 protein [Candidatus Auribacterota bacterium]